ncbi:MAG: hypothetical protein B7Z66_11410 [Chromatiales bacterium 21-64-14]|nr:MAG: hypothetical protein B7Z66_11410 [Chromatiales bacterium 21-64-14]HQU17381.1 DUF1501 domain-containing protein [Gammaproteobacteria bacterium]
MQRRQFLKRSALLAAGTLTPIGKAAWAARGAPTGTPRLIVVFLRGAVDGLNVVIPYADEEYYEYRPLIGIPAPGRPAGALDLDGHFGLHPALEAVLPLWKERSLAFVHACGSPDPSRSHFEAQAYMETATPGIASTRDGWLNRLLAVLPHDTGAVPGIAFGPTLPRILHGPVPVTNFPTGRAATRAMPTDRPVIRATFDRVYSGHDPLSRAYREGVRARQALLTDLQQDMSAADEGAPSPVGFSDDTARLARMISADPSIHTAFFALGGWDTHVNEGATTGQLADHLRPLAEGLTTLAHGLGPHYRETVILVMSEFGRTARENGNGGTDHGHGNALWVLGGPVHGGRVLGSWPGLDTTALYQERDLAVTTDFRAVIDVVLEHHLGLAAAARRRVLPEFRPAPATEARSLLI